MGRNLYDDIDVDHGVHLQGRCGHGEHCGHAGHPNEKTARDGRRHTLLTGTGLGAQDTTETVVESALEMSYQ
jgi:hypothetical protein